MFMMFEREGKEILNKHLTCVFCTKNKACKKSHMKQDIEWQKRLFVCLLGLNVFLKEMKNSWKKKNDHRKSQCVWVNK